MDPSENALYNHYLRWCTCGDVAVMILMTTVQVLPGRVITLLLSLSILLSVSVAQAHFGEKFEPEDGSVLHGLGQYVPLFYTDSENWQYVSEYQSAVSRIPALYSAYQALNPVAAAIDSTDISDIMLNHGHAYGLNLGLAYVDTLWGEIDVAAILAGEWDERIGEVAREVASLGGPFFIRPGFEFGAPDGFHGDINGPDFIAVWHHVRAIFAAEGVENAAWVWNAVNPGSFDVMSYYPGDEAVDWWGVNTFTVSQMNGSLSFISDAAAHAKPVIICESCPIHGGGTENPANWEAWFLPYFSLIEGQEHVKGFCYISDPWDRSGCFDWWDNSRIDADPTIAAQYAARLADPRYIHLASTGVAAAGPADTEAIFHVRENPARETVHFLFAGVGTGQSFTLDIFAVSGRHVATCRAETGNGDLHWDGCLCSGSPAPSAVYIARLRGVAGARSLRFVLLR